MNQYVNSFDCAINPTRNEIVISLKQQFPIFDVESTSSPKVSAEEICSVIMNADIAKGLVNTLSELLNADREDDDVPKIP